MIRTNSAHDPKRSSKTTRLVFWTRKSLAFRVQMLSFSPIWSSITLKFSLPVPRIQETNRISVSETENSTWSCLGQFCQAPLVFSGALSKSLRCFSVLLFILQKDILVGDILVLKSTLVVHTSIYLLVNMSLNFKYNGRCFCCKVLEACEWNTFEARKSYQLIWFHWHVLALLDSATSQQYYGCKRVLIFFVDRIGWTCRSFVRVLILDCLLEAVFHIRDSCEGPKLSTKKLLCPSHTDLRQTSMVRPSQDQKLRRFLAGIGCWFVCCFETRFNHLLENNYEDKWHTIACVFLLLKIFWSHVWRRKSWDFILTVGCFFPLQQNDLQLVFFSSGRGLAQNYLCRGLGNWHEKSSCLGRMC